MIKLLPKFTRRFSSQHICALSFTSQQTYERYHWSLGLAAGALGILSWSYYQTPQANACGIVGYVGQEPSINYLLEGLLILQNRGYDSAGVATVDEANELVTTKYASVGTTSDSIDLLQEKAPKNHPFSKCGIAHTRWATHGAKTDENAHPHTDYKNRVALVHNGTIENCMELRKELEDYGITFKSQTDTEVIVQLVGYYLDQGQEILKAVRSTLERLEGSWGLAIISVDKPDEIIVTCNGSPLIIGVDEDMKRTFVASEHTAFSRYTNEIIPLKDREIVVVTAEEFKLDRSRVIKTMKEDIQLSPEPYPHWTVKEIFDQPVAVQRALGYGSRLDSDLSIRLGGLDSQRSAMVNIDNLVLSACGTSLFASEYGALLMRYLHSVETCTVIDAAECGFDSFPRSKAGLCVLSQSGETKDVIRVLNKAQEVGVPAFSLVNCVGSAIARKTGLGVYTYAGREHAVASTKAFMNQVVCLSLVAGYFSKLKEDSHANQQRLKNIVDALLRLTACINITLRRREQCKEIAQKLIGQKSMFVLGKGFAYPIAQEGALKIKEITYIHAEGYSGGALKHGPFALIEEGTPIILVIPDDQHARHMVIAAHEVQCRGAHPIVITDNPALVDHIECDVIAIPSNGVLTALLSVIPLQLLAYELAVRRGIDPDKPRHLAKAVTVD